MRISDWSSDVCSSDLNTIRHILNDDERWWRILKEYNLKFRHSIVTAEDVIDYFSEASGLDLHPVFDQYLRYTDIPCLELKRKGDTVRYRWLADAVRFGMPVDVFIDGKENSQNPTTEGKSLSIEPDARLEVAEDRFFLKHSKGTIGRDHTVIDFPRPTGSDSEER